MRAKTIAIVAGAGSGRRLGLGVKKPFVSLGGKPLIIYCLKTLDRSAFVDGIIVACEKTCTSRVFDIIKRYKIKKAVGVVAGGPSRAESVRNCLRIVDDSCGIVLIHDAARPFLSEGLIRQAVLTARRFGGAVAAVPEKETVKSVGKNLFIKGTIDRSRLWRAQTPQAFRRGLIKKAYERCGQGLSKATDDASLVEKLGRAKVKVFLGSYGNIKITTKEDLLLAEGIVAHGRDTSLS